MATKDPGATATLWANRLAGATNEIQAGVQRVTEPPGQKAAAQVDVWLARLQASRAKWVRNVSAVTLPQWQASMINKGIPRIAGGAQAAIPKMTQFFQQWLPYVEQGASTVRAMPKATLQDGINRAVAMIQYNSQFVRQPYTGI
jgi:hypothetical protein